MRGSIMIPQNSLKDLNVGFLRGRPKSSTHTHNKHNTCPTTFK